MTTWPCMVYALCATASGILVPDPLAPFLSEPSSSKRHVLRRGRVGTGDFKPANVRTLGATLGHWVRGVCGSGRDAGSGRGARLGLCVRGLTLHCPVTEGKPERGWGGCHPLPSSRPGRRQVGSSRRCLPRRGTCGHRAQRRVRRSGAQHGLLGARGRRGLVTWSVHGGRVRGSTDRRCGGSRCGDGHGVAHGVQVRGRRDGAAAASHPRGECRGQPLALLRFGQGANLRRLPRRRLEVGQEGPAPPGREPFLPSRPVGGVASTAGTAIAVVVGGRHRGLHVRRRRGDAA